MSWFKKLTSKTKLVLVLGIIVILAGLVGGIYWLYRDQISASTFTYDKCTLNASITRDPTVTGFEYVHIFNAVNYQRLKEDPSSQLTSIVRMNQSNPTATVPTILNQRYYAVIHKPDGTPVLDDNASFLCHSAKTIAIYADLNNGTIRVFSPPVSSDNAATADQKCIDQGGEYVLFTKSGDFWYGTQQNGNKITRHDSEMQGYISDLSKCSQQITSGSQTGATIASSQNRKCIRFDYNDKQYIWVTKDEGRNIWIAELDQNLMVTDSEATRLNETDTSKCGATAVAADTKCVLMGSTWIWIKKNGNDWCNAKNCTVTYKDSYVSTLSADSTGAKCGPLSTSENVQPAVGAPVEGKLLIPIFGSGRNFPTGNNSVSFKAVRYSLAEEDPVQIALSGQGSQSFFHYTPVGGANFEMTLLTQATPSQNTGLGNSVAHAQVAPAGDSGSSGQTGVGGGGASGQTGTGGTGAIGQTGVGSGGASGQTGVGQSGSGPINTGEVTQLQCEKDTISEDILSQIRRIREFRSYRISGTIPDNGTNSAISVINLPDGFYKVQVSKSGFSSCTAYFALEKGESPDIGGIPLVAKSSTLEPPSISSAQVSKIPGDDRTLGNIYVAQKSSTKYVYSSKCTRLGWVPEGQVGAMINTPLCQRNPQISQSGGNVFTDENGNPLTGPALQAVLANIYNRCSGANISIFGGSSGNDKMNPLEAMLIGAAGGAFEAQMNRGEIVTRDVVYPAGLALIAALTGSDVNIGVGNNCIGQSLPPYNMGIDCRTCYYCPPGAMCDPGPAPGQQYCPNQCYTQSWPNQIPWYMLDRAQSRMGR